MSESGKDYRGERVLVVPRAVLFGNGAEPHGFGSDGLEGYIRRIGTDSRFEPRSAVEDDPSLKQIIPYVVVTHGRRVFLLKRREKQTEARLRNLYSVGVGGHINPVDTDGGDPVIEGLRRELFEEVTIREDVTPRPIGWLNDDTNPVGSVHFGLVFHAALARGDVEVAEKDMMEGRFIGIEEAFSMLDAMETWSRLLLEAAREDPRLLGA